ncbi:MAG: hypothetical protein ORO03_08385, partial [Alphaproteobacteria bacterium]|nr:hypothetical protein [Alphaproteobacteria bacterium]
MNSSGAIAIQTGTSLRLNGDISAGGAISLTAITSLTLGAPVTTRGGAVTIDIGTTGVWTTGGNILGTSNRNLTLTAGSVTGTSNQGTVFELGSGTIAVTGQAAGIFTGGHSLFWNYNPDDLTNHKGTQLASDPNELGAKWGFSVASAGEVGTVWMDFKTLAAGKVVKQIVGIGKTRDGLDIRRNTGTILFRNAATSDSFSDIDLGAGHEMTLVLVGGEADRKSIAANLASSTSKASKITFEGNSYFSGDLNLHATGDITQSAGKIDLGTSSLSLSGANITLSNSGNLIGTLGAITATGAVTVTTSGGLTLNGTLSAGGAIGLTATGLTLGSAISTSGGDLTLHLGTGTYATGGFTLSTSDQNLSLTAGSVSGATPGTPVFALGSGTITVTGTAAAIVTAGATQFFDFDSAAETRNSSNALAFDPTAAGAIWRFFGASVTAAERPALNGIVWMNGASLTAGKVVKQVSVTTVARSGLDLTNPTGNIQFRNSATTPVVSSEVVLDDGHRVQFFALGTADSPLVMPTLPLNAEIHFIGDNYFKGNLVLKVKDSTVGLTDGFITQDGASSLTVTDGKLIIASGYRVILDNPTNRISSLGGIAATATVDIATGTALTLTGDLRGAQINLSGVGITIGESITVSASVLNSPDLVLNAASGAISQNEGKNLTLATGQKKLIVKGSSSITLTNSGNRIARLGDLQSSGAIRIRAQEELNPLGDINAGGEIALTSSGNMTIAKSQGISFRSGGAIRLTAAGLQIGTPVTSSGGAVTIDLGTGTYFSSTGTPVATSPAYGWTTTDQNMTLIAGNIVFGTGTLVNVGTAQFRTSYAPKNLFTGERIYISENFSPAEKSQIREIDSAADFHTVTELNQGIYAADISRTATVSSDADGIFYTGDIHFEGGKRSYPSPTATITFWNVRGSAVTVSEDTKPFPDRPLFNGTLRFDGSRNSFSSFNFASTRTARVVVATHSQLNGPVT